jgi:hypothetical protein
MPEIIRELLRARLPANAISGDYLTGNSFSDLVAKNNGTHLEDPFFQQQMKDAGMLPWAIGSLQLDR